MCSWVPSLDLLFQMFTHVSVCHIQILRLFRYSDFFQEIVFINMEIKALKLYFICIFEHNPESLLEQKKQKKVLSLRLISLPLLPRSQRIPMHSRVAW